MTTIDRRTFLRAGLGVTAAACGTRIVDAEQQSTPAGSPRRIDMHHHFAPPAWVADVKGRPLLQPANTRWTAGQSIEDMDRGDVAAAVVSITNPGLWFGDSAQSRRLARACNDYGARLVSDHPTRFGLFAALPLPDVDAALMEIAHAYDTLKTDGIAIFTSYGDKWLGNPEFRPVMEELNRRRAVVAVHPTAADCCRNLAYAPGVGPGSIEYGTDTTRAIMGVAFSGDAVRFPDIRFIWSHAGGTVPFLAGRIEAAASGAKAALVCSACTQNNEVRHVVVKSSWGPDGGNPSSTRQGRSQHRTTREGASGRSPTMQYRTERKRSAVRGVRTWGELANGSEAHIRRTGGRIGDGVGTKFCVFTRGGLSASAWSAVVIEEPTTR